MKGCPSHPITTWYRNRRATRRSRDIDRQLAQEANIVSSVYTIHVLGNCDINRLMLARMTEERYCDKPSPSLQQKMRYAGKVRENAAGFIDALGQDFCENPSLPPMNVDSTNYCYNITRARLAALATYLRRGSVDSIEEGVFAEVHETLGALSAFMKSSCSLEYAEIPNSLHLAIQHGFPERWKEIIRSDFVPSNADLNTPGINWNCNQMVHTFRDEFLDIDLHGIYMCNARRRWYRTHGFPHHSAVLFTIDLTDYVPVKDWAPSNRLGDVIPSFESIIRSRFFDFNRIQLIVFFVNTDRFKALLDYHPLHQYFPAFPANGGKEEALGFVRDTFLDLVPPRHIQPVVRFIPTLSESIEICELLFEIAHYDRETRPENFADYCAGLDAESGCEDEIEDC